MEFGASQETATQILADPKAQAEGCGCLGGGCQSREASAKVVFQKYHKELGSVPGSFIASGFMARKVGKEAAGATC